MALLTSHHANCVWLDFEFSVAAHHDAGFTVLLQEGGMQFARRAGEMHIVSDPSALKKVLQSRLFAEDRLRQYALFSEVAATF